MEAVPREARTPNVSKNTGWDIGCRYCADSGYVVVALRREPVCRYTRNGKPVSCQALSDKTEIVGESEHEELGPCPFCERGFFEEFGDREDQNKADPVKPPWWKDGFWQGRVADIRPLYAADSKPLPAPEYKRRLHELRARFAAAARSL